MLPCIRPDRIELGKSAVNNVFDKIEAGSAFNSFTISLSFTPSTDAHRYFLVSAEIAVVIASEGARGSPENVLLDNRGWLLQQKHGDIPHGSLFSVRKLVIMINFGV